MYKLFQNLLFLAVSAVCVVVVQAADSTVEYKVGDNDDALTLTPVADNVYAIVGPLGNRSPKNLGNNATFGFVVTTEGVVLVDPGGSYKGAQRIHAIIKGVTDKPIRYVINTGGQDHRWLGNEYFKQQGAKIIASKKAVADQHERAQDIFFRLISAAGKEAIDGTHEVYADIQFDTQYELELGGVKFLLRHPGAAHSPGDTFVWLADRSVMFSGDIIYMGRLLSVMNFSNSRAWVNSFAELAAYKPRHIVPGHGEPTDLASAQRDTYGYLQALRKAVGEFMELGGVIQDVGKLDMSAYQWIENFELLNGRNLQQVYQEMEWE